MSQHRFREVCSRHFGVMHPICRPPKRLSERPPWRADRRHAVHHTATGETGSNSPCPCPSYTTRNSLSYRPKMASTHGRQARTVSGGSIHAVISAMCEDAPNLFSNGSDQRAPAMAREPTACGARWGKYSGYATLRKIPNVCSDNTSRNPLDKRPQPIQVIFLSGSRNRSYDTTLKNNLLPSSKSCWRAQNKAGKTVIM